MFNTIFQSIPQARFLLYCAILGLLPTLGIAFYFWQEKTDLDLLEERIDTLRVTASVKDTKQALNNAMITHYKRADNFYIDKQIEKLQLMELEVEGLREVINNKSFADDEEARKRLEFLTGGNNSLTFNEGAVVRYPQFREVIETQVHPVEVNLPDILRFLTLIEGVPLNGFPASEGIPQLIVLDFKIDKKKIGEENEVFSLNTRLLKREYL